MEPAETVLAREFPDRDPAQITPATRGNRKRTFLVDFADADSVVVQLSSRPDTLRTEVALARAVRERTSVPVPATLASGTVDSNGYVVVERALGVDLHERFAALPVDEQAIIARAFGRWLAACHEAFSFDDCGPLTIDADGRLVVAESDPRAWFESYLAAGLDVLPSSLADLRADIEAATATYTPHDARLFPWDLRPGNALYDETGVTAVLDWGEPLAADPGLSAAKTEHLVCDWYVDDPRPLRRAFSDGYRDLRTWPEPSLAERLTAVVRSAVDSRGAVTRPGYPERTGEAAVRFHRDRLVKLLPTRDI